MVMGTRVIGDTPRFARERQRDSFWDGLFLGGLKTPICDAGALPQLKEHWAYVHLADGTRTEDPVWLAPTFVPSPPEPPDEQDEDDLARAVRAERDPANLLAKEGMEGFRQLCAVCWLRDANSISRRESWQVRSLYHAAPVRAGDYRRRRRVGKDYDIEPASGAVARGLGWHLPAPKGAAFGSEARLRCAGGGGSGNSGRGPGAGA